MLSVSIGRASALTGLRESQVRYFEELKALHPAKATASPGSPRLYTLNDLRRLYTLAQLVEHGYRPIEAAETVKQYAGLIERGDHRSLADLVREEDLAATDGFMLACLAGQLMDTAEIELNRSQVEAATDTSAIPPRETALEPPGVQIIGMIMPMKWTFTAAAPTDLTCADIQQIVQQVSVDPSQMLIAFRERDTAVWPGGQPPRASATAGHSTRTLLFYSREPQTLPPCDQCRYCVYAPRDHLHRVLVIMVAVTNEPAGSLALQVSGSARTAFFDRTLQLCELIFRRFRRVAPIKAYRYYSDGSTIAQNQQQYQQVLRTIRHILFPQPDETMAVLLIPDSLEQPATLSVLAHDGYVDDLAMRAKLDLHGAGQGLSGRAFLLREPFLSLDAQHDARVAYALEEHCGAALAAPLAMSWCGAPFGVLYLAVRNTAQSITSELAYVALAVSSVLSELLGRWWLTQLRHVRATAFYQNIDAMIGWLDSLDRQGPDLQRALDAIQAVWTRIEHGEMTQRNDSLALVVFDIDNYRQNVQIASDVLFPMRAQIHLRAAIRKILPGVTGYWFKHDHALLVLEHHSKAQAGAVVRRIANQVKTVPLAMHGTSGKTVKISVSAAIQVMTYQDLYDLDPLGGVQLRQQVQAIIEHLRTYTSKSSGDMVYLLDATDGDIM